MCINVHREGVYNQKKYEFSIEEIEHYRLKMKDDDTAFHEVDVTKILSPHPGISV